MYVGITAAALEQALQYARDRHAFGRPIGAFQAVQHPLADVATDLEQIRLITAKAAWLQSVGRARFAGTVPIPDHTIQPL